MTLLEEFQLRFGASASADDLAQFVREKSQVASSLKVPGSTSTALYSGRTGAATRQRHQASADYIATNEGADMAIRYDRETDRAIDDETGEYLDQGVYHYQNPTRNYLVHAPDGSKLCSAEVKQRQIDTRGDGTAGRTEADVVSLVAAAADGSFIPVIDSRAAILRTFERLLRAYLQGPSTRPREIEISLAHLFGEAGQ
jgi:hypothetical protein